jgi:hypothetical protein
MSFSPDMIVSGDDTPRILFAVEVKLSRPNGKDDKTRLETHMVQVSRNTSMTSGVTRRPIGQRIASFPSPGTWQNFKAVHRAEPHPNWDLKKPCDPGSKDSALRLSFS